MSRKSDGLVVPGKLANNASTEVAEPVEGRGPTKSNSQQRAPDQTQRWSAGTSRLLAVRQLAQRNKKQTFNNLFSLMDEALLTTSFYQLKRQSAIGNRQSAAGCDGVTWQAYEQAQTCNIGTLVQLLREGRYRPKPARRVFIPKEDGSQRPLSIICLEDKIVQQAAVTILNQIYETDFLGFSYGFRLGRGQHDALDALTVAIKRNRVNWVLDLDISKFFDTIEHSWMLRFVAHRVTDKRMIRLLSQWLKVGTLDEHGHRVQSHIGSPQGAVISPPASQYLSPLCI
ncbi:reverse transcriptase domain-containing protein [Aeromonas veronii]